MKKNCRFRIQNWLLTCDVKIELKLIISYFFKDVHWGTVCSFSGLIGFIVSLLLMIVLENQTCLPDSIFDRAYIVLIGVLSFAGQVTLVYLAKIESNYKNFYCILEKITVKYFRCPFFILGAGTTALLRKSFDVILAFAFQIIFFSRVSFPFLLLTHYLQLKY